MNRTIKVRFGDEVRRTKVPVTTTLAQLYPLLSKTLSIPVTASSHKLKFEDDEADLITVENEEEFQDIWSLKINVLKVNVFERKGSQVIPTPSAFLAAEYSSSSSASSSAPLPPASPKTHEFTLSINLDQKTVEFAPGAPGSAPSPATTNTGNMLTYPSVPQAQSFQHHSAPQHQGFQPVQPQPVSHLQAPLSGSQSFSFLELQRSTPTLPPQVQPVPSPMPHTPQPTQQPMHHVPQPSPYSMHLVQLNGMGFTDNALNTKLLEKHKGSVDAVINELLNNM